MTKEPVDVRRRFPQISTVAWLWNGGVALVAPLSGRGVLQIEANRKGEKREEVTGGTHREACALMGCALMPELPPVFHRDTRHEWK